VTVSPCDAIGFRFTVNTVWPMSVPEFMRESIVLCSTCRMWS